MTLFKAEPTADHAAHFARLAQIAGDQVFSHLFGSRARIVLESMFRQRENDNSHVYTTFLLEQEDIAGMMHAYPAAHGRQHASRSSWLYLRYAAWQIPRALAVGIMLSSILEFIGSNLESGDFYIAMLALYPPYRGRGHSKTLLNRAQSLAAEQGCSRLTLDVDERNTIARAAYERTGFEQIAESKKVKLEGETVQLLRLAKPVGLAG